jgi:phospholipid-transporting ATPase
LLRGSSLRNTEWIYGLVVFTGHESKIMMNSVRTKAKYSKLERATNFYILLLVSIQMLICITAALFNFIWTLNDLSQFPYLDLEQENKFLSFAVSFGVWFLSFVNFVPISLMVTLECVKFVQGYYI